MDGKPVVEIKTAETFDEDAADLFEEDELEELFDKLRGNPTVGDLIPGTGGLRKVRTATLGGARVWYLHLPHPKSPVVWLVAAYPKNQRADLTEKEKKALAAMARAFRDEWNDNHPR